MKTDTRETGNRSSARNICRKQSSVLGISFRLFRASMLGAGMLIMLSLMSCATFFDSIEARVKGVPVWTLGNPSNTLSSLYFVGEGISEEGSSDAAEMLAYEDLLQEIARYTGADLLERQQRELIQEDRIAELSVRIEETFQKEEDGVFRYYLLAAADRKNINDHIRRTSEQTQKLRESYQRIADEAEKAYSRREDYTAVHLYLEAARQAYETSVPDSREQAKQYLGKAADVLAEIQLTPADRTVGSRTFGVSVSRGSGAFALKIADAEITASFTVQNTAGKETAMVRELVTDVQGSASLTISHPGFRGVDSLVMKLELSEIEEIYETFAGDDEFTPLFDTLRNLRSRKYISIPYTIHSKYLVGDIFTVFYEADRNSRQVQEAYALNSFIRTLAADGIESAEAVSSRIDDIAMTDQVFSAFPLGAAGADKVIAASVEISTIKNLQTVFIATAEGILRVIDAAAMADLRKPERLAANGMGQTRADAEAAALTRFGEVAAATLLNEL